MKPKSPQNPFRGQYPFTFTEFETTLLAELVYQRMSELWKLNKTDDTLQSLYERLMGVSK